MVFCSQLSRDLQEPLAGTGKHAALNLLLSWPSGQWNQTTFQAQDMTAAESTQINQLIDSGWRVNLIDRKAQAKQSHKVYLMPENLSYEVNRNELLGLLSAINTGADTSSWQPQKVTNKLILCCTHGKKDKCCAKFGNASYQALSTAATTWGEQFDIWQSTHLGGCRLAASAIAFNPLHKYGRIEPDKVEDFLASEANNQPYLPSYRGASDLEPAEQCAELAARHWLSQQQHVPSALTIHTLVQQAEHMTFAVQWSSAHSQGQLTIDCTSNELQRFATCKEMDQEETAPIVPIWQAIKVTAIT